MKTQPIFSLLLLVLLQAACTPSAKKDNSNEFHESAQQDTITPAQTNSEAAKKIAKSNAELLQGKWQSDDDKSNFLVFEQNQRKEIANGMTNWDDDEFILSDHCENESNKADNSAKEKDSYISCTKSDYCWYITTLDSQKLVLQYMGRGNTLSYTRVNE